MATCSLILGFQETPKKKKGNGDVKSILNFWTSGQEADWGRTEDWLSRGSNEDQGVG